MEFCNDKSVMGRAWTVLKNETPATYKEVPPAIVDVVVARGFDPERFFNPTLRAEMPDPSRLKGMDDAVKLFCDAVQAKKKIAIYGDYDVDGATSTSMMVRWLRHVGLDPVFYIPDRITEGYGPNVPAIRKLATEMGVEFILFLDCGTRAHASLEAGRELGLEMAIIDHHLQDDRDPCAVLVNPNRRDETKEFGYLCTAGLVFLFLVAVQREMRARNFFDGSVVEVELKNWLGIVALGTVCDIVPLVGLNRAYVKIGLPLMDQIAGLRALRSVNTDADYNERTCGFVFGPCINAEGRIGDTRSGTILLSTDDEKEALEVAMKLFETNKERKELTDSAKAEGIRIATEEMKGDSTIVIYNDEWHPGIVGIVASKVKDATNKPTVIIGNGGTGSCRSVTGYDIGAAVDKALDAGLLKKGGGHAMAAGVHLDPANVDAFRAVMCVESDGFEHPELEIDMALACGALTPGLIEAMDLLAPFGKDNPHPRVVVMGGYVARMEALSGGKHLKLHMQGKFGALQAVLWNAVGTPLGDALAMTEDKWVDVYGKARVNFYGGRKRPELVIEDAMIREDTSDEDVSDEQAA